MHMYGGNSRRHLWGRMKNDLKMRTSIQKKNLIRKITSTQEKSMEIGEKSVRIACLPYLRPSDALKGQYHQKCFKLGTRTKLADTR